MGRTRHHVTVHVIMCNVSGKNVWVSLRNAFVLVVVLIAVVVLRHCKLAVSIVAIVALIIEERWDRNVCILNGTNELLMTQMNKAN